MEPMENLKTITVITRFSACFIGFSLLFFFYRIWINGYRFKKPMDTLNKVVIITGASKGIGKAAAFNLAKRGAHIIMACNDIENGILAQNEIINETGNPNVKCMYLNLGSFKSIREFVNEFLKTGSRLDVLINNASVFRLNRETTDDGIEQTIGINCIGHVLLTMLLLKRLSESMPSRIIILSNWSHRCVDIDRMDLMSERQYCSYLTYARSQLANCYFGLALTERLIHTGVTCNIIHSGISLNGFFERLDEPTPFYLPKWLLISLSRVLCKSERACAETLVYAAFDFSIQTISGLYISDAQIGCIGENTKDTEITEWLWKKFEEITNEKFDNLTPSCRTSNKII